MFLVLLSLRTSFSEALHRTDLQTFGPETQYECPETYTERDPKYTGTTKDLTGQDEDRRMTVGKDERKGRVR